MKYQYYQSAEANSIFAKDAFENSIGKPFKLNLADISEEATLVAAEVIDDGKAVLMTIELKDDRIKEIITASRHFVETEMNK